MATDGRTHYEGCWHEHEDCMDRHVAELEAKLAACDWTPISPDNLPQVGDEVLYGNGTRVSPVICEYEFDVWKANKDTHRRPIHAPLSAQHGEDETK